LSIYAIFFMTSFYFYKTAAKRPPTASRLLVIYDLYLYYMYTHMYVWNVVANFV